MGLPARQSHDRGHRNQREIAQMAKAYYSTVFEQTAPESGKSSAISTIIRSGSAAPAKARSRMANPAIASARSGTCSIRSGGSGSGCWRNPTSSGRKPTNSAARHDAVTGLPGHPADHAYYRWRPGVRRMVGDVRLRSRPARRTDRNLAGLVREMARIAPRHDGGMSLLSHVEVSRPRIPPD